MTADRPPSLSLGGWLPLMPRRHRPCQREEDMHANPQNRLSHTGACLSATAQVVCVWCREKAAYKHTAVSHKRVHLPHTHIHICGLVVFSVSFVVVFRCEIRHIFVRMMSCLFALPCEPPKLNACAFVQAGLFGREECAALFGKPVLRGAFLAGLQQGQ